MPFGVTSQGFIKPTEDEIEAILAQLFRDEFSSDITLAPETFLGQQLAIFKKREMEFWDVLENAYYEIFFNTATGLNLDKAAFPFARRQAQKSVTILTFTGDIGTIIPVGSLAETQDGVQFETTEEVEIDSSLEAEANAVAVLAGNTGNVPVGGISELPIAISGVDSVTNNIPATGGEEIETDADFQARVRQESQQSKSSSVAAIRTAVLALEGVTQVTVNENATDAVVDGIPPNSIQVVVNGSATNQAIAFAIYSSKAAGIGTFGSEEVIIEDEGQEFPIRFDFAEIVDIYVDVNLTVNSSWISDYEDIIKARVLEYIGGVDPDNMEFSGVQAGEDVLVWKISASLFNLENRDDLGILDVYIEISRTSDPSSGESGSISILPGEEAVTDFSFIAVNTTLV